MKMRFHDIPYSKTFTIPQKTKELFYQQRCVFLQKIKKRSETKTIALGLFSVQFTVILLFLTFKLFICKSGKIFDYFYFFCDIRQAVKAI